MTASSELLQTAAQLLDARIGLKPDASFRPRLARALRDVADEMDIDREELVASLGTNPTRFDALVNQVTVQESGFFRHPEQFDILARVLVPTIHNPLRAWSAATANGQEAYSLAMIMQEIRGTGYVLATDVSPDALQRTITGSFHSREMGGISAERRQRHFIALGGDSWRARPSLREMVTTRRHNLLDPIPPQVSNCQVVMCRNVLIYLKQRHAEFFLDRLADAMDPAACLFIGAAETLWQMTDRFEPAQIGVSYVYRPIPRGSVRRSRVIAPRASATAPLLLAPLTPGVETAPHRFVPTTPSAKAVRVDDAPVQPLDEAGEKYGRLGRELRAAGALPQAIIAFRQWAYLSPDDPTSHFQLGSALDAAEARAPAIRAYRAALAALDRCDAEQLVGVLHGFNATELRRLLIDRCGILGDLL